MTSLMKAALQNKSISNKCIYLTEFKRFAGHSKWANIKHTKMLKDQVRANVIQSHIQKMRFAIAEGKSAKPEENPKLAKMIEYAKKQSVPLGTIKNFLEKMSSSKSGSQLATVEAKGPSGCIILIHMLTDNLSYSRSKINVHLKKTMFGPCESTAHSIYKQTGIILIETENHSLDKLIEDAIEVGAEDAEKCKEDDKEFFQITCHHSEIMKVRNKLEDLNYKIIQAEVEFIPKVFVTLKDEEMEMVSKLFERLNGLEEIVKVYTNIA